MILLWILGGLFWSSLLLLFWTYFGYPFLMFMWSRVAPSPITKSDILPSVTLLVPAYNESDVIGRKLDNTVALTYPKDKLQVLIIDDGSTDGTPDIIQSYADRGITLLRQPERGGKMGAVNMGFANATGEIVVLSDASPDYEADALQTLVRSFADDKVGVIVGTLAVFDSATGVAKQAGMYWKYEKALRKWESNTGSTVAVHGNMFAMRRKLFKPLSAGTVNDEFSLAMETIRQGYRVVYEPDAISYDDASANMGDEFNRRARINAGRFQALFGAGYLKAPNANMTFRLFSHKLLRPLSPIFMLIALLLNMLLVILPTGGEARPLLLQAPLAELLLVGQLGFYGLAWLGGLFEKRGYRKVIFFSVPYFFVSSNLAALVGFWRWLRGSQRVTWKKRSAG